MKRPFASNLAMDDIIDKFFDMFCGLIELNRLTGVLNPVAIDGDGSGKSRNPDGDDALGSIRSGSNRTICLPLTQKVYNV